MRCNAITGVLRDDSGAIVIEYGLLVLLVSAIGILYLTPLGEAMSAIFEHVTNAIASVSV